MDEDVRGARRSRRPDGPTVGVLLDSSAVKPTARHRARKGGRTRQSGARATQITKIHVLTDKLCRPLASFLTGGQVASCITGERLLQNFAGVQVVQAGKGYERYDIRRMI